VPLSTSMIEAKVTWRQNTEASLPAEALVQANFNFSGWGRLDKVAALPGILTKTEELVVGLPIVGASAKVSENSFLFALSGNPSDAHQNAILLSERYIDLALVLDDGRNAILTLEKDETAGRLFRDTLEAWVE